MTTESRPDGTLPDDDVTCASPPSTPEQRAVIAEFWASMKDARARGDAMRAERLRTGAPVRRI